MQAVKSLHILFKDSTIFLFLSFKIQLQFYSLIYECLSKSCFYKFIIYIDVIEKVYLIKLLLLFLSIFNGSKQEYNIILNPSHHQVQTFSLNNQNKRKGVILFLTKSVKQLQTLHHLHVI